MASNHFLVIPENDLALMLQQSENETNTMIAGMLSIIHQNDILNESLKDQPWCKRMFHTIIGKNKAAASQIRQNHDKINAYFVQAVGELYKREKISSQMMASLGLQITKLYDSHLELKSMLPSLFEKLNEKVDSNHNYMLLLHEIENEKYGSKPSITGLMSIVSQLDQRMISNPKNLDVLKDTLLKKNLLNADFTLSIQDFLMEITNLDDNRLGIVYTDLQLYQNDDNIASLAVNTIESWNLLSASNRKLRKKQTVIDEIIRKTKTDKSGEINVYEFYNNVIALRQNYIHNTKAVSINENTSRASENDGKEGGNKSTAERIQSITGKSQKRQRKIKRTESDAITYSKKLIETLEMVKTHEGPAAQIITRNRVTTVEDEMKRLEQRIKYLEQKKHS